MNTRNGLLIGLLLLICLTVAPNVQAQTTTLSNLQYPTQAVLQNGVAQVTVALTVGFSNLPSGYYLGFGIVDAGTSNYVTGSVTSTPDSCAPLTGTNYVNSALCATTPTSSSGTESASFTLTLTSARQYNLVAAAVVTDKSGNVISSSASRQTFAISVIAQVHVTIGAQPANATVTVDGVAYTGGQLPTVFTWDPGSSHVFQVNPTIQGSSGVRYVFVQWSDGSTDTSRTLTATQDTALTAEYKTQYQLIVVSDLGDPQGAGWYDSGTQATFSVASPQLQSGLVGTLGGKMVFQSWTGDSNAATTSASVVMDRPKMVTATWTTDNTQPYILLGALAAGIAVIIAVSILMFRRKRAVVSPLGQMQTPAGMEQRWPPTAPGPAMKFCKYCGKPISGYARFCKACGRPQS